MIGAKKLIPFLISLFFIFLDGYSSDGPRGNVKLIEEEYGYSIDVYNNDPFTIYLNLKAKLQGLEPSVELPTTLTVPQGVSKGLLKFTKIKDANRYSIQYEFSFSYVKHGEKKPDDYLYYFPFEHGKSYRIDQGWNGRATHQGQAYYAVDFNMATGTKLAAVRDGIVVEVKEDSKIGGPSRSYMKLANAVLIKHDDDTFSSYGHLKYQGVLVNKGDKVKAGDIIALSGNTGFSPGPHLHFCIYEFTSDGKYQSIPFKFRGKDNSEVLPEEGRTYYAYLPGGEEFEEIRGSNINISDFDDYSKPTDKTSKLDLRYETYDDRVVIFIKNGMEDRVNATVNFQLKNLESELGNPISIKLKPLEERFLTVLLVKVLRDVVYSYGSSISYTKIGEEFKEMPESNINVSDFDNYSKPTDKTSKLDLRYETYGNRLVVFIKNGIKRRVNAKVSFKLKNLKSELGNPISIKLKPLEERFLTILLIKDAKEGYSYGSSISYTY